MQMMEDKGRLMKYSTFLNSAILELFMFSFSGNGLIDEVREQMELNYFQDFIIIRVVYMEAIRFTDSYDAERRDRRVGIQQRMDRQPFP